MDSREERWRWGRNPCAMTALSSVPCETSPPRLLRHASSGSRQCKESPTQMDWWFTGWWPLGLSTLSTHSHPSFRVVDVHGSPLDYSRLVFSKYFG
jgi:hypothetical protein